MENDWLQLELSLGPARDHCNVPSTLSPQSYCEISYLAILNHCLLAVGDSTSTRLGQNC